MSLEQGAPRSEAAQELASRQAAGAELDRPPARG
jgi:hypothetical protein